MAKWCQKSSGRYDGVSHISVAQLALVALVKVICMPVNVVKKKQMSDYICIYFVGLELLGGKEDPIFIFSCFYLHFHQVF